MTGRVAWLGGLFAIGVVLAVSAVPATAQVQAYGTNDYGGFHNVLPPGTNGFDNPAQLAQFEATGQRPQHNDDQLAMYSNLTTAAGSITDQSIPGYFKNATFGVPGGDVQSTETPEPGVTIVRDKQFGVPHIYGDTRAELMFGIGYATAEDRLFFIDALRHAGQGQLASFAGGSNVGMDESVWASEPYTQQDLRNQVNYGLTHLPDGAQVYADATSYVNGINAYITRAEQPLNELSMMPAEYLVLGKTPQPFTLENLVSIGTVVGGSLGGGGGQQLSNAVLYENLTRRFGPERYAVAGSPQVIAKPTRKYKRGKRADHSGFGTFVSFDDPNDPEAPTTVRGRTFSYQTPPMPSKAVARTIALPALGSVRYVDHVVGGAPPTNASIGRASHGRRLGHALGAAANAGPGLLAFPQTMSNALLVSARDSAGGHPLAVMGPQVSYFTPQILMEEDIHGPGIDADGAAFAGVNQYVEFGHGQDYAWSATSAGQNIIDTFAVPLCNPAGGRVAGNSDHYLLHGRCVAMQTLTDHESWTPSPADQTPAGSITLQTQRTAFGIVIARARARVPSCRAAGIPARYCNARGSHTIPVIYTNLRSTYMHELDSSAGVAQFNNPAAMRTPQGFFNAAYKVGDTFNWFYANNKHIAYFNSGHNPVRAPHTDPLFPSWSTDMWRGYHPSADLTPLSLTERQAPVSAHPHTVDQSYLTNWNNKQAAGYQNAATGQEYASVYRSQLLDSNINYYLRRDHHKMTLADLINAMGLAGTQDLRGVKVLPYALKVLGRPTSPALRTALDELRTWVQTGAHRINRQSPGAHGDYEQTNAVRIMDAWWPLLVKAEFGPVLGSSLLQDVESRYSINDEPGHGTNGPHLGSAFDVGFYGIAQKDLRSVLHKRVRGPLNRVYCGRGSLRRCRAALRASLARAAAESPSQVYPADGVCQAGDQMCSDSIQFRALGAITQPLIEWVNRPTFQQADQILGHGPG